MTFPHGARIDDPIRREQIEEARRMAESEGIAPRRTLSVKAGYESRMDNRNAPPARKPAGKTQLKGHEAFLKALELSGADVEIEKTDGTIYRGKVKHADKYTITINVAAAGHYEEDGHEFMPHYCVARDRVVFKHDISEFSALTPRVERTAEEGVPA